MPSRAQFTVRVRKRKHEKDGYLEENFRWNVFIAFNRYCIIPYHNAVFIGILTNHQFQRFATVDVIQHVSRV